MSSLLAAVLVGLAFINTPSAHAIATSTSIPISFSQFVPCANNGRGEVVTVSGTEHDLFVFTTVNGGVNGKFQSNFQGVTGFGQTTGTKYQATGVGEETFTGNAAQEFTENQNFFLIGQGTGNNLLVHQTLHMTFNPDGTMTANVDNLSIECR